MYFRIPFATSGDRATIPNTDPGAGQVNWTNGYGGNYSLDPDSAPGALRIARNTWNEFAYQVSDTLRTLYQWGVPPFIESADNGGSPFSYGDGAIVQRGGVVYQSNVASNTTTPPGASWTVLDAQVFNAKANVNNQTFTGNTRVPTVGASDVSDLAANTSHVLARLNLYGIGTAAPVVQANLNTLTIGCQYQYSAGATGAPSGVDGVVIHVPGGSANDWFQIAMAFDFLGTTFVRYRDGGTIGAWTRLLSNLTPYVTAVGSNANGTYRTWSNGQIEIWRTVSVPAGSSIWLLPITIPNPVSVSFGVIGVGTIPDTPSFSLSTTGVGITTSAACNMTVYITGSS